MNVEAAKSSYGLIIAGANLGSIMGPTIATTKVSPPKNNKPDISANFASVRENIVHWNTTASTSQWLTALLMCVLFEKA